MILSLSHVDLDGVSCQFVLGDCFGMITKMNIGYDKIDEYIENVDGFCTNSKPTSVFITDLSFTYEQLNRLTRVVDRHEDILFYFIDHHPFEEDFKDLKRSNFVIIISNKASASMLTYKYLESRFNYKPNNIIGQYIKNVNAYDIWSENESEFKVGFVYNELFWNYGIKHFVSRFNGNYNLNNKDKEKYKEIIGKKNKLFNKLKESGRIFEIENKSIFMIFIDEFISHVTLDFKGFKTYIIVTSRGSISVRLKDVKDKGAMKNLVFKKVSFLPNILNYGGHDAAFGIKLIDNSPKLLIEFSKELLNIMNDYLNDAKEI